MDEQEIQRIKEKTQRSQSDIVTEKSISNPQAFGPDKILRQSEVELILADLGMPRKQCRIGAAISLCEAPAKPADDGEPRSNFAAIGDQQLADEVWGYSYGGFQIRSLRDQKGTGSFRDEDELLHPRFNCRAARAIYRIHGWSAWSTFTSGQYKAYLQDIYPPPPNVYVVLAGDTLTGIKDKYPDAHWTWQDLADANSIVSPYTIYVGQALVLPV